MRIITLQIFFLLHLQIFFHISSSQSLPSNTTGYACNLTLTSPSCQSYAFFTAMPPNQLDLSSIADSFSLSRPMIAKPSNITSLTSPLVPNQPLFIPLTCTCNSVNTTTNISYAKINYTIQNGDNFYLVSTAIFHNLTTYQSVEVVNPTLVPTNLSIGQDVIFPIFCKCPTKTQLQNGINYLISYVFQPFDNISAIASRFGSSTESIIEVNGNGTIKPTETIFVPVSKLPELNQPVPSNVTSSQKTERTSDVIGLGVGLGVCGVLLILMGGFWGYRESVWKKRVGRKKGDKERKKKEAGSVSLMADVSDCLDKYKVYRVEELNEATNGFDERLVIEGSVFKGYIHGKPYAIKKMNWNAYEELKILQKVNHGNLVMLEGFCIDSEDANCYLVYEYLENGSLYRRLHENKIERLNWRTRLGIAVDVANGLQFTIEFIKCCWKIVKKDIVEAIQDFGDSGTMPRGCNSAFISLIPKKLDATEVQDFRPISLVGIIFKILSKTLAQRLKRILHLVVNPIQSAFVQDRQILDGPLIINETIDWVKRKKKTAFMFKTDIAKAYDSVSWKYLDNIMEAMNFGHKWRRWVSTCLSSSAMSVLVNGSPSEEFVMKQGLRQGDPISPLLFTLVMEGLSLAVHKAVNTGAFKDLKVGKDNISISHLFFADDAVFIGDWTLDNAICIIGILMCFKKASGLQVNYQKSRLYGIGLDNDSVRSMANLLGCKAEKLPSIFLGIPIGDNMKRIENWRPIVENFHKKLSNWKAKTLSIGGRLTIVSNVMGGIPNYWLSLFPAPKGVLNILESKRRNFFWGPKEEGKTMSWISWRSACHQRRNGGLGIIGLEEMNISLLAKWIWRFKNEDTALWVQVIKSIHGHRGSLTEDCTRKIHPCIWKNILLKIHKLKNVHLDLTNLIQVNIGDGDTTSFWEDKWNEEGVLKTRFPRMYALEEDKNVSVRLRMQYDMVDWNRRRGIRGGIETEEADTLRTILDRSILSNRKDKWAVPGTKDGIYSTKWLRDCMETHQTMGRVHSDSWNKWVPKKYNVFIWRLLKNRIPTRKKLSEMGIDIPTTLCPFCEREEEDIKHLFFECHVSSKYWQTLSNWWRIPIPPLSRSEDPLNWSFTALKKKVEGSWLRVAVIAVLVSIWRTRNGVIFEKKKVDGDRDSNSFINLSFLWLSSRNQKFKMELNAWTSNPNTM